MAKKTTKKSGSSAAKKSTGKSKSTSQKKTAATKKTTAASQKSTGAKKTSAAKKSTASKKTGSKKPAAKKPAAKKPAAKKPAAKKPAAKKPAAKKDSYPKIIDRRLEQLYFVMDDLKLHGLVLSHLPNIRYMTNFSGSAAHLFIYKDEMHFVTDDRYEEQIKEELYPLPNLKTHITRDVWTYAKEKKIIKKNYILGFEADFMPYSEAVDIRNQIRPVKFKPAPDEVERFMRPKAEEELEYIKKACELAEQVYEKILGMIKPGMTEREIATEISYQGRLLGSEGDAFDIIVGSGPRGAFVHGQPSDKEIKNSEIVLLDFGCIVNGFRSDITRTFAIGKATKDQKSLYKLLHDAQKAAIDIVIPGMNGKTVDEAARSIIEKAGYGNNFKHSLGHGIGLKTHENPIITFRKEDQIVPENCVLAIEPGIYLPDKFGMRIEDDIHVTLEGAEYLTKAPEELLVI